MLFRSPARKALPCRRRNAPADHAMTDENGDLGPVDLLDDSENDDAAVGRRIRLALGRDVD